MVHFVKIHQSEHFDLYIIFLYLCYILVKFVFLKINKVEQNTFMLMWHTSVLKEIRMLCDADERMKESLGDRGFCLALSLTSFQT